MFDKAIINRIMGDDKSHIRNHKKNRKYIIESELMIMAAGYAGKLSDDKWNIRAIGW